MLRLYTDESPGLKVDPVVVLVLSLVFIFSVVALHSMFFFLLVFGARVWRVDWMMGGLGVLLGDWKLTRVQQSSPSSRAASRAKYISSIIHG